jgi:hypothetical protein
MTSVFDAEAFLGSEQSAGFDTRYPLHKAGDWEGYIGAADKDIAIRSFDAKDKNTGEDITYTTMEVMLYTDNPAALSEGAVAPARCRLSIFLDLTPDGKTIDMSPGKNKGLGYLLTATGFQDKTGKVLKPWSKSKLAGLRLKYTVTHSPQKKNPAELQDSVSKVAAA